MKYEVEEKFVIQVRKVEEFELMLEVERLNVFEKEIMW